MMQHHGGRCKALSLIWPITGLMASAGAALGLGRAWYSSEPGWACQATLSGSVLGLTIVVGTVWALRGTSWRKLNAVMDAYAQRELAQGRNVF